MSTLELTVFGVDHGSAAHLRTPDGHLVVFDAGASESGSSPVDAILAQMVLGTVARVDGLVISHAHADHIRELSRFDGALRPRWFSRNGGLPSSLLYGAGGWEAASASLKHYVQLDASYNTALAAPMHRPLVPGEASPYLGAVRLQTFSLTPADFSGSAPGLNDLSLLSVIQYGNASVILPGDLEPLGQCLLLRRSDVQACLSAGTYRILIAPHHGRRSGIAVREEIYPQFVETIKPCIVIMSDAWGCEHTCPELYRPRASGHLVWNERDARRSCVQSVLTTKGHDEIRIRCDGVSMPMISAA